MNEDKTIQFILGSRKESIGNLSRELNSLSTKIEQTEHAILKLKIENKNLQDIKCSYSVKLPEICDKKKKLFECIIKQKENKNKLSDELHKKKEHLSCLKRESMDLDEISKKKTEELQNIHCDHSSTEAAVESIIKELFGLKQRNKKEEQTFQELSVWLQAKDSQMTIKKESITELLAKNDRIEEMVRQELIDATAEVAALNEEQENLAMAYQKLKESLSAYKLKLSVEIKELSDQQDQLTCTLANVSIKLAEKCDANCQLMAYVKANNNRIGKVLCEVNKLERWVPLKSSRMEWHKKKIMIDESCLRDLRDATREKLKLVEENYNLKQTLFQTGFSYLQKATSLLKQCPTKKLIEICY